MKEEEFREGSGKEKEEKRTMKEEEFREGSGKEKEKKRTIERRRVQRRIREREGEKEDD